MGIGGYRHAPTALSSGKRPGTHCVEDKVSPRAGVDGCGESCRTAIRPPDRLARNKSLYD